MHEMSIMAQVFAIIETTKAQQQLEKINQVKLKIGQLTCIEESSLRFAFSAFAASNQMEEAELKIDWIPARAECVECGLEFKVERRNKLCPNCNSFCQQLLAGEELYLSTIEGA